MLTEILRALPAAVCATDTHGRVTWANAAAEALAGPLPTGGDRGAAGPHHHSDGRPMRREETAFARALAEGVTVRVQGIADLPGGGRAALLSVAAPQRDATGRISGVVEVMLGGEVIGDGSVEARLAAIVASSDDAVVSKTLDGVVTSWNAAAARIFGYAPEEMVGQPILRIIPPELQHQEREILARLRRGERVEHFDTERLTRDGRRVHVSLTVSPVRDAAGRIVGASKIARDISERVRAEATQRLLVGELNHRVKNTLATVQAIARQSLRLEPDPGAFAASFTGRVQALARAHDLLMDGDLQRVEVAVLAREEVELGGRDQRVTVSGPKVSLDSRTALQLALVLHELATNARRHGALARSGGRVAIAWTPVRNDGTPELALEWRETGVPNTAEPDVRGLGSLLIERSLLASGGRTTIRFLPDGMLCEISLPLPGGEMLEAAVPEPEPPPDAGPGLPLAGLRVLVVEDEPLIAMDVEERLMAAGAEVIGPAANLSTARRLIAETAPDAALLDANLAGTRVDELALELRRRTIPFAFATGFGRASLPEAFQSAPVLAKPFGADEMVAMVLSLVARPDAAPPEMPPVMSDEKRP